MLDSGAAVNVCPVDYFPEYGIQSGRRIELQGGRRLPCRALRFQGCGLHGGQRGDECPLRGVCEGSDLELGGAGRRRLATWYQGAYDQRDDVSQTTPALLIFRLLLSIAVSIAPIFCGSAVVLSIWDDFGGVLPCDDGRAGTRASSS